jgi:hypothetical protein
MSPSLLAGASFATQVCLHHPWRSCVPHPARRLFKGKRVVPEAAESGLLLVITPFRSTTPTLVNQTHVIATSAKGSLRWTSPAPDAYFKSAEKQGKKSRRPLDEPEKKELAAEYTSPTRRLWTCSSGRQQLDMKGYRPLCSP